jgi:hypothetical protein
MSVLRLDSEATGSADRPALTVRDEGGALAER